MATNHGTTADVLAKDFKDLVASLQGEISQEELEAMSMEDIKTTLVLRLPVKAYAQIANNAREAGTSESSYVISVLNDALGMNITVTDKGRPKSKQSEDEKKAEQKLKRAKQTAMAQRMLAELGVS